MTITIARLLVNGKNVSAHVCEIYLYDKPFPDMKGEWTWVEEGRNGEPEYVSDNVSGHIQLWRGVNVAVIGGLDIVWVLLHDGVWNEGRLEKLNYDAGLPFP